MPCRGSSMRRDRQPVWIGERILARWERRGARAGSRPSAIEVGITAARALGCHVAQKRDRGFLSVLPGWEHRRMPDRHCARAGCAE